MADRTVAVLTVSDSVAAGTAEDRSGPAVADAIGGYGFAVLGITVVPDGVERVAEAIASLAESADLVITTGGTGLSPRDLTPEATRSVIDREVPGLSEAMRSATFGVVPHGMLSRGVSGLIGGCVVVNLPGSVKAVTEGLSVIGPALAHAVDVASGRHGRHD